jgi:hypothetical protein
MRALSSVGAALELPRSLDGVLNRRGIAVVEIGDDHHVFGETSRDVECLRVLAYERIAVAELGPDHQLPIAELACHQPTAIAPLRETASITAVYSVEPLGAVGDVIYPHSTIITRWT